MNTMGANGSTGLTVSLSNGSPTGWVEVWIDRLDLPASEVAALTQFLTPTELALCDRCRLPHVRQHKIVARARLRQILSGYLDRSPLEIEITTGLQGKPQVAGLEFNLSHSGDLVAYAVSDLPVGIDIERIRSMELSGIIQRFFAPNEFVAWQKLPPSEQSAAFFRTWTVKEAYLKAIGTGLHTPLSAVEVSMDSQNPKIIQAPNHQNWQLHPIPAKGNHYWGEFTQNLEQSTQPLKNNPPALAKITSPLQPQPPISLPIGYVGALVTTTGVDKIEVMKSS
jgi:4'-phosphopantetheinyl transferase